MGIQRTALISIADDRIKDAEALLSKRRYDGASYLCGYAIELALKARLCRHLKWEEFPRTNSEFQGCNKGLKTHKFDDLLKFTGIERKIRRSYFSDWSIVSQWTPETRYEPPGLASREDAEALVSSAKKLVKVIGR